MKLPVLTALAVVFATGGCAEHHHHVISGGQVEMYLAAPRAQSVVLVVASEPFQQVQALRDSSGIWKVSLRRRSGFTYFYLVDGKTYLPDCRLKEYDDFGSNNCIFSP